MAASVSVDWAQAPATTSAPAASAPQATGALSSRGLGAIRLGMSAREVRTAFRSPLKVQESGPDGCLTLASSTGDISFVLQDDKLRLIQVEAPGVATRSGLAVGMALERVKQALGSELVIGPNFYDDSTTEAIVWEADHGHGVRFTARAGRVTAITAGDQALEWVEGCGV